MISLDWIAMIVLGAAALVVLVTIAVRQGFHMRIDTLCKSLERAAAQLEARTDLPPEVGDMARRLGAATDGAGRVVNLTQSGQMWLKPGAKALAFSARQIIAVTEVGFLWSARFRMAGLPMRIIDYLVGADAGLQGRLLDVLQLVNVVGGDAAYRGEAMRYLSELIWAPDAILFNRQLEWRVIDACTLAVATGGGVCRSEIRLILDEAGDPVRFEADDRPYLKNGAFILAPWFGRYGNYLAMGGRRIPTLGEVGWRLGGTEFIYWRGRIEARSAKLERHVANGGRTEAR